MNRIARSWSLPLLGLLVLVLTACASPRHVVDRDDGRPVDDALLAEIRAHGKHRQLLQTALVRSAVPPAPTCERRWELPFATATGESLDDDTRIAWRRALGVSENLTVIAASPATALRPGDQIVGIDGGRNEGGLRMQRALLARRDAGRPFELLTAAGASVQVQPLAICRGEFRLAAQAAPMAQDYHWDFSLHPLELMAVDPTDDEMLWMVVWTQGLSEEGGARMKAYQYGLAPARMVLGLASLVSGIGAVANIGQAAGASAASEAGLFVAKTVATSMATDIVTEQAGRMMNASSENRASLKGVAWAAGTVFDQADAWAFARMRELGADPLAGIDLHRKLVAAGRARNAFVLDADRLPRLQAVAEAAGLGGELASRLAAPALAETVDPLAGLDTAAMPQVGGEALPMIDAAMPLDSSR